MTGGPGVGSDRALDGPLPPLESNCRHSSPRPASVCTWSPWNGCSRLWSHVSLDGAGVGAAALASVRNPSQWVQGSVGPSLDGGGGQAGRGASRGNIPPEARFFLRPCSVPTPPRAQQASRQTQRRPSGAPGPGPPPPQSSASSSRPCLCPLLLTCMLQARCALRSQREEPVGTSSFGNLPLWKLQLASREIQHREPSAAPEQHEV